MGEPNVAHPYSAALRSCATTLCWMWDNQTVSGSVNPHRLDLEQGLRISYHTGALPSILEQLITVGSTRKIVGKPSLSSESREFEVLVEW